jgi:hypothetical protein
MSPAGLFSDVDEGTGVVGGAFVGEEPDEPSPQALKMAVAARRPPLQRRARRAYVMVALLSTRQGQRRRR